MFTSPLKINFFFILNFYKDVYFFILPLKLFVLKQKLSVEVNQVSQKTINQILKRRCVYFLFLTGNTTTLHWKYQPLINSFYKLNTNVYILNFMFFREQFNNVFNVLYHLLLKKFLFFIFNFESMCSEISAFNKYVLGINIVNSYSFIFKTNLNQLKTNF